MTTTQPTTIRVLAFRDGEAWVAQCIEYDIAEQGGSLEEAMENLEITVSAECQFTLTEHGEAFKSIDPAPMEFEAKFETLNISLPHSNMEYRIAA